MTQFVQSEDELKGKRAECVSGIIEGLVAADGDPIPYAELLEAVGMSDQPAQMMPAMVALELVGAIIRYTYTEIGKTKSRLAFALSEDVEIA